MEKKVAISIPIIWFIHSIVQILSKISFDGGVSPFVFVFFRQAVATAILLPAAFVLERNNFPSLSVSDYFKLFALAFCGNTFSVDATYMGISYTSATLASATTNSVPVITFVLAVLLRKESISGELAMVAAKIAGVVLCMGGVVTMALYQGPKLPSINHHRLLVYGNTGSDSTTTSSRTHGQWILGSALMIISSTAWSLFLILQRGFFKKIPSMLTFTTLLGIFSTMQTFVAAWIFDKDFSKWKSAVAPMDIFVYILSGLAFFLQSWCIKKIGAVIYTMTVPLTLVFTMVISSLILGEETSLGSVIAGTLMVSGLYSVILAKQKEETSDKVEQKIENVSNQKITSGSAPSVSDNV